MLFIITRLGILYRYWISNVDEQIVIFSILLLFYIFTNFEEEKNDDSDLIGYISNIPIQKL